MLHNATIAPGIIAYPPYRSGGGISPTSINFTGQRLDATGLLYYHARMYDLALGRFVSADSDDW
jgi:RHS repeat-associated protein